MYSLKQQNKKKYKFSAMFDDGVDKYDNARVYALISY